MQTMKMYGSSDDLVEIEDVHGGDKFNCYALVGTDDIIVASFILGGRMRIRALYDGCWSFAVGQVTEEIPLPAWPMTITSEGYSAVLTITVPDDAAIFRELVKEQ